MARCSYFDIGDTEGETVQKDVVKLSGDNPRDSGSNPAVLSGSWAQLPRDASRGIHSRFICRFGFSPGEVVGWVSSDHDVPL